MAEEAPSPEAISNDDWDTHWGDYASTAEDNPAQAYRRRLTFTALARDGAPQRLLDIGSGQGDLLAAARAAWPDAELCGVELSATGVTAGERKVPNARFVQRNLLEPAEVPADLRAWATHAVCSEVLEHVDEPATLLRHALPMLAPGCHVVITVPAGPRSKFDRHIGHRRHFTTAALHSVLADAGLESIDVAAAGFPVFNLYKLVVIARGDRLIDDVKIAENGQSSRLAGAVMRIFQPLFRAALPRSPFGWQLIATACVPDG